MKIDRKLIILFILVSFILLIGAGVSFYLLADRDTIDILFLILSMIFSGFMVIVSIFIVDRMLRPIRNLIKEIEKILNDGTPHEVEIGSHDDIGRLISLVNKLFTFMARSSKELLLKTDDLKGKVKELENNKSAMVNLLEDIDQSREEIDQVRIKDEAILFGIGVGLVVIEASGRVDLVNDILGEMLGMSRLEMLGKKWNEILIFKTEDNLEVPIYEQPIQQVFDLRQIIVTSPILSKAQRFYLLQKNNKRVAVQITASPLIEEGNLFAVVAIIRNITKEIELERTKTEFVSIASHQLRTPLSTVNWYTEMLLARDVGDISPKQEEYLREIYKGNQRMVDLVNALLNVSRLEVGAFIADPKMVNLATIMKETLVEVQRQIVDKNIELSVNYGDNIPDVQADPSLVKIIFQNLITNAVKYSNSKVDVSLSLQNGVLINHKDKGDLKGILIKVSDDGMGIPEVQKEQIFSKLFRADNARLRDPEGNGLGLYITKSIIDQMGGAIWFDSEENKGATFWVLAPIHWMDKKAGTRKIV